MTRRRAFSTRPFASPAARPQVVVVRDTRSSAEIPAGSATVVAKLFNIAGPCRAYFGEKDFQQLRVVTRMARDLDLGVKVIGSRTVRERDGLAMSSRNVYLSPGERQTAQSQPMVGTPIDVPLPNTVSVARISPSHLRLGRASVEDGPGRW